MKRRDTVALATVHGGTVSALFHTSVATALRFDARGPRRIDALLPEHSSANVSISRNAVVARFLDDTDCDWLWWVDSDQAFEPDALEQLLDVADPQRAPIVSGLTFREVRDHLVPAAYDMGADTDGNLAPIPIADYPRDAMVQVAAVPAAFLLVHRSVLEAVRAREFSRVYPWFQEIGMAGQVLDEGVTFTIRAGVCEFPVWLNTAVPAGHHRSRLLTEELFLEQQADGAR